MKNEKVNGITIYCTYDNLESILKCTPHPENPNEHPDNQIELLARIIKDNGFRTPITISNLSGYVTKGHGRLLAAKKLGMKKVPVDYQDYDNKASELEDLLADNKIAELSNMNDRKLYDIFKDLEVENADTTLTGYEDEEIKNIFKQIDFFEREEKDGDSRQEGNEEYNEFLDKFEEKKTTDDCYTPEPVYDAVVKWVENEYKVDRKNFVRPFYPGGDYEKYKYKSTDIVVDNPPFSILAQILKYYSEHNIKFFLFAPALTLFSSSSSSTAIGVGVNVIYENKANVNTSFLTNLETDYRFRSSPTLYKAIKDAVDEVLKESHRELQKNDYPDELVTSTMLTKFSKYGVDFKVLREETAPTNQLDAQKEKGVAIFGKGYLISEKAAAEKAAAEKTAAEKTAAEKWQLSDRERQIVKLLAIK